MIVSNETGENQYPKGSEWRKWDLHIHSNASDGNMTCEEIIEEAKRKDISVIGLTDHHTSKNIDIIKKIANENEICAIGGVEFRTEYGEKSVHLIGLFPNKYEQYEMNSKNIEDLILNPLGLTEVKIVEKGKQKIIDEGKKNTSNEKAFKEGMFLVQVDFKKAANLIHKYGGIVIVHAGTKENSLDKEVKHIGKQGVSIENCLGSLKTELFTEGYIDICEIRKENDDELFYLKKFGKASIVASDAHEIKEIGSKYSWIKGDPSFDGLRYLLNEPETRVNLSEKPELFERVLQNETKYIEGLSIKSEEYYDKSNGKWFDNTKIVFGKELTAIIGNKGSGKSAVTDIIGLCSNSKHSQYFSFLRKDRFLENGYSENYKAKLYWVSNINKDWKSLSQKVDITEPDEVQYLPQGYFEKICNEVGNIDEFKKEINTVVFQHIPEEDKHGMSSFDDFIESKKKYIQKILISKKQILNEINIEIVKLEEMRNPKTKLEILNKIKKKENELEALKKPIKVNKPKKNTVNELTDTAEMTKLAKNIEKLKEQLEDIRDRIKINNDKHELLKQFKREVEEKQEDIDHFIKSYENKFKLIKEIKVKEIIKYEINEEPIIKLLAEIRKNIDLDKKYINEESIKDKNEKEISLVVKLKDNEKKYSKLRLKLDEPSRKYEDYKNALKIWEEKSKRILGSVKIPDTLNYYKDKINYIENILEKDIEKKRQKRIEIVKEIYNVKCEIIDIYLEIKKYIDRVIKSNQDHLGDYNINIISEFILQNSTIKNIINYISKNVVGTYYGIESAENKINTLFSTTDINNIDSIINCLNKIIKSLERDERNDSMEIRYINDQIINSLEFYNYIFSLDYLDENYELKLGEKKLEKLSPGEKGALLIVFYLLLDKSEKPLILDQPEDNLDNESVSTILVPFIKEAKKRRQIIMVTHNPNLAVYADAEQVIRVFINKDIENEFSHSSGGIENEYIKDHIINVLEGTMPAFSNRSKKYSK